MGKENAVSSWLGKVLDFDYLAINQLYLWKHLADAANVLLIDSFFFWKLCHLFFFAETLYNYTILNLHFTVNSVYVCVCKLV